MTKQTKYDIEQLKKLRQPEILTEWHIERAYRVFADVEKDDREILRTDFNWYLSKIIDHWESVLTLLESSFTLEGARLATDPTINSEETFQPWDARQWLGTPYEIRKVRQTFERAMLLQCACISQLIAPPKPKPMAKYPEIQRLLDRRIKWRNINLRHLLCHDLNEVEINIVEDRNFRHAIMHEEEHYDRARATDLSRLRVESSGQVPTVQILTHEEWEGLQKTFPEAFGTTPNLETLLPAFEKVAVAATAFDVAVWKVSSARYGLF
jgi:hypothetical protein